MLLSVVVLVSAWTVFAFARGTLLAVRGEGAPEIIWPAVAVLGLAAFFLSRTAWRMAKRLRGTPT